MLRALTLFATVSLTAVAGAAPPPAPAAAAPRRVEIQVTGEGYKPSLVKAAPGEKLTLVFKGTKEMGCCDQIVIPAANWRGKVEADKSTEVTVTVPPDGKLVFACSMSMCRGTVGK